MTNKYTIRQRIAVAELVEVLSMIGRCDEREKLAVMPVTKGVLERMHRILHKDADPYIKPHEFTTHGMVEAKRLLARWIEKYKGWMDEARKQELHAS